MVHGLLVSAQAEHILLLGLLMTPWCSGLPVSIKTNEQRPGTLLAWSDEAGVWLGRQTLLQSARQEFERSRWEKDPVAHREDSLLANNAGMAGVRPSLPNQFTATIVTTALEGPKIVATVQHDVVYDGEHLAIFLGRAANATYPAWFLESWQTASLYAMTPDPSVQVTPFFLKHWNGCQVVASPWSGWWDWLGTAIFGGNEPCPLNPALACSVFSQRDSVRDAFSPYFARLYVRNNVPVRLVASSYWFMAPGAGFTHQLLQVLPALYVHDFFDVKMGHWPVVPPMPQFPSALKCSRAGFVRSRETCPLEREPSESRDRKPESDLRSDLKTELDFEPQTQSKRVRSRAQKTDDMLLGGGGGGKGSGKRARVGGREGKAGGGVESGGGGGRGRGRGGGQPERMEVYVAHDAQRLEVEQLNVADLMGETVFLCAATCIGLVQWSNFSLLSRIELDVDPSWGVYQGCNFGTCEREAWILPSTPVDPALKAVGRLSLSSMSPEQHADPDASQCGATGALGQWFNLPAAGHCRGNSTVGTDGCTWRAVRVVKTVDVFKCVQSKLWLLRCEVWYLRAKGQETQGEFQPPPTHLAQRIEHAFQSDEPWKGGCPPVHGISLAPS